MSLPFGPRLRALETQIKVQNKKKREVTAFTGLLESLTSFFREVFIELSMPAAATTAD